MGGDYPKNQTSEEIFSHTSKIYIGCLLFRPSLKRDISDKPSSSPTWPVFASVKTSLVLAAAMAVWQTNIDRAAIELVCLMLIVE
jgi:hypothetical protein